MENTVSVTFTKTFLTANQIIPEAYQNVLLTLRDRLTITYFQIGDISDSLVSQAAEQGFRVTEQEVFDAVGDFIGKSGRTIRYYTETARFYPPDVRDEFENVPFARFVFARGCGALWRTVLEVANANPYWSEDRLRYEYTKMLDEARGVCVCVQEDTDGCMPSENSTVPAAYPEMPSLSETKTKQVGEERVVGQGLQEALTSLSYVIGTANRLMENCTYPDVQECLRNAVDEFHRATILISKRLEQEKQ